MKKSIESLKSREAQLKARIVNAENKARHTKSRKDTRKKVLVGTYFRREYLHNGEWMCLMNMLDSFLTRPYDRALFGLPVAVGDQIIEKQLSEEESIGLRGTILIGAYFLDQYKCDLETLVKRVAPFIKRNVDRELFGLPTIDSDVELLPF
ncbi:MAG: hypothetical protein HKP58_08795 [Desulfatitalea sp.]|nr:hypothetical protein [Desulfatitalea sp.]NNK00496.1 hypothetical protein [Desulfatitalea sp.]